MTTLKTTPCVSKKDPFFLCIFQRKHGSFLEIEVVYVIHVIHTNYLFKAIIFNAQKVNTFIEPININTNQRGRSL